MLLVMTDYSVVLAHGLGPVVVGNCAVASAANSALNSPHPPSPPTPQEDFERRNKIVQQFKMKVTRAKNMCIWWCMTKVCVAAFAFVECVCCLPC